MFRDTLEQSFYSFFNSNKEVVLTPDVAAVWNRSHSFAKRNWTNYWGKLTKT